MKKFVFILLCLFVFPFNSFGEDPSKEERTFTGKLDLPEAAEPGYYPPAWKQTLLQQKGNITVFPIQMKKF